MKKINKKEIVNEHVEVCEMETTKILSNAQALNEEFKDIYGETFKYAIRAIEEDISDINNSLERDYNNIRLRTKKLKDRMAELEMTRSRKDDRDFSSDMEALLNHKYVEKVEIDIDDRLVFIFTDYIDIYDEDGNKYAGNRYRIRFNFDNMSVRFYGLDEDYCRRSYWTEHDPHPHVDGDGGYPCLGDAGSMLAQTLNDYEIYASFIIALNFLQQVNTSDPAGKFIKNWDCIDENGDILENPHYEPDHICSYCECTIDNEDDLEICAECGNDFCSDCCSWLESVGAYVCESCVDEHYVACNDCEDLIHEDNAIYIDSESYNVCRYCYDNGYIYCDRCQEYYHIDKSHYIEKYDNYLCDDCYEEVKEENEEESGAF